VAAALSFGLFFIYYNIRTSHRLCLRFFFFKFLFLQVVNGIGDILLSHWEGSSGETVKRLFGDFCSKQNEITNFFKELMKTDKKFHTFMKVCLPCNFFVYYSSINNQVCICTKLFAQVSLVEFFYDFLLE